MEDFGPLQVEIHDGLATLTFNDPARRNPISAAMVHGLMLAMQRIENCPGDVHCVLITGHGTVFSSGGDMAASRDITTAQRHGDSTAGSDYTLESHHHPVLRSLRELHCPVITAINGPAVGMGLGYALAGDLIIAARSARFTAGFVRVGMSPDAGVSWHLPRLIGAARARQMLLLGDPVSADQALSWGLVNQVVSDEELMQEARALAARLIAGPPLALDSIRQLCRHSADQSFEVQIDEEQRLQRRLGRSEDALEGFRAFLEKRAPGFVGR